ncbi:YchJ family metal-binding protein [Nocardioides sp. AN3]
MSPPSAYRSRDGKGELHERSRFEQRAGRWLYVDGEVG